MSDDAERTLAEARQKVERFVADLTGDGLVSAWSEAATALYKEQYALKQNPYGEAWTPRRGDETHKASSWKFGAVTSKDRDGFSLRVAKSNKNRSCVPFEPRSLGRWKEKFREVLTRRASAIVNPVK